MAKKIVCGVLVILFTTIILPGDYQKKRIECFSDLVKEFQKNPQVANGKQKVAFDLPVRKGPVIGEPDIKKPSEKK